MKYKGFDVPERGKHCMDARKIKGCNYICCSDCLFNREIPDAVRAFREWEKERK